MPGEIPTAASHLRIGTPADSTRLVGANALLESIWSEDCRPSLRWLREQTKRRTIPYRKIGNLVFFDPTEVRAALDKNFTVKSRN